MEIVEQSMCLLDRRVFSASNLVEVKSRSDFSCRYFQQWTAFLRYSPVQDVPFPEYPVWQMQLNEPTVLVQLALGAQSSTPAAHSSKSVRTIHRKKKVYITSFTYQSMAYRLYDMVTKLTVGNRNNRSTNNNKSTRNRVQISSYNSKFLNDMYFDWVCVQPSQWSIAVLEVMTSVADVYSFLLSFGIEPITLYLRKAATWLDLLSEQKRFFSPFELLKNVRYGSVEEGWERGVQGQLKINVQK